MTALRNKTSLLEIQSTPEDCRRKRVLAGLAALLLGLSSVQAGVLTTPHPMDWLTDPGYIAVDTTQDLVLGLSPTIGGGASSANIALLTDGTNGPTANPNTGPGYYYYVTEGAILTYDIGPGSTVDNIRVTSGWGDGGRDRQDYVVSVSADNITFTNLATVAGINGPGTGGGTMVEVVISEDAQPSLVAGIRYVRFTFTNVENGGVAYTEIVINGSIAGTPAAPQILTDLPPALSGGRTLPFALSVVASGNPLPRYKWYKNGTEMPDAIGTSLVFQAFKPADVGTYYVRLENSQGGTNSTSCVVTMTNPPPQTVPLFVDVTSQNTTFDPIDVENDLIQGLIPGGYTNGTPMGAQFNLQGIVDDLTDGQSRGSDIQHLAIFPSGTVLTYALPSRSDITNIATYSAWPDSGRDNQDYILSISTNAGVSFTAIATVAATSTVGGSPLMLRVMISPNGPYLATNVTHVRFSFPTVENNGVGYGELVVQGTPSPQAPLAPPGLLANLPPAAGAGRQLPFSLSVTPTGNPDPIPQWYKDGNSIPGATLPILEFPRFAPSDAGTYYVTLANSQGATQSVSCVVTMTNQPSVKAFWDTFTQNSSFDPLDTTNDLIFGVVPLGYTNGQTFVNQFGVDALIDAATDGQFGPANPFQQGYPLWFQSDTAYTWALPSPSDITQVETYSGWPDSGRVNQDYVLSVSVDGGATFQDITTINAIPSNPTSPVDLKVLIVGNGAYVARYVTHVRFTFGSVQNGGVGYTELMVKGTASPFGVASAQRDFWQSTKVTVAFSKPVTAASAAVAGNYTLNQGATVGAATLLNPTTVELTTSPLPAGPSYVLTVNNVQETGGGTIAPNTQVAVDVPVSSDTIRAQSSQNGVNLLVLEAEHYNQNTPVPGIGLSSWAFTTTLPLLAPTDANTNYSGAGSMLAIPNSGVNKGSPALGSVPSGTPRLDFKVLFTAVGTNYVWVRGVGDSSPGLSANDSVFIGLDGVLAAGRTGFPQGQGYAWSQAAAGNSGPIVINTPGLHVINVWMREDGFTVDKLLLSSDSAFNPGTGTGPVESAGPPLTITRSGNDLILNWVGGGTLQSSSDPAGAYTDVVGAMSPWPITPSGAPKFYRVRQ